MRRTDRTLDLARDLASDLDRYLVSARDLARELDRHFVNVHYFDLAHELAHDLDLVSARARVVIVFFSDPALARALALARDLTGDRDRDRARDLVSALSCARRSAAFEAGALVAGGARPMPGRVTRGLVTLAVRLLPVAQRPHYREEFGVELVELPRRARWGYALRVMIRAWDLREALVEGVRTSGGAPARRAEQ